jgi:hypothetical protein
MRFQPSFERFACDRVHILVRFRERLAPWATGEIDEAPSSLFGDVTDVFHNSDLSRRHPSSSNRLMTSRDCMFAFPLTAHPHHANGDAVEVGKI